MEDRKLSEELPILENFDSAQQDQIIMQTLFVRKSNIALQERLMQCLGIIHKCVDEYHIVLPENQMIVDLVEEIKQQQIQCKNSGDSMTDMMIAMAKKNGIILEDEIPKNLRWW